MYIAAAPLSLGLLLGGMGFFSFIIAPTAFRALSPEDAAAFVRRLFPTYYLYIALTAGLACVGLVGKEPYMSVLMLTVAGVAMICRQVLTPAINRARDRELSGDDAAGRRFALLHRGSVALNFAMLAAGLTATVVHV